MHVHLTQVGEHGLPFFPLYGVTHVRDMGGNDAFLTRITQEIEAGQRLGPQVRFSGPVIEAALFAQSLRGLKARVDAELHAPIDAMLSDRKAIDSVDEATALVGQIARSRASLVKFRSVSSPDVFEAIAKACDEHDLELSGHEPFGISSLVEASDLEWIVLNISSFQPRA